MGIYIYLSEYTKDIMSSIPFDNELDTLFQEARKYDDTLLIKHYTKESRKHWWSKKKFTDFYHVYHEERAHDGSMYQARLQTSGSGKKGIVRAYLYGIINGILKQKQCEK